MFVTSRLLSRLKTYLAIDDNQCGHMTGVIFAVSVMTSARKLWLWTACNTAMSEGAI